MRERIGILCLALLAGCSELADPVSMERAEQEATLAQFFDPATTGTIEGRVVWDGDVPAAVETVVRANPYNPHLYKAPARFVTPHVPMVHAQNGGVANAVVFLRGIDPRRSKPWDHAQVRVEFQDRQLRITQGDQPTNVGFVRRGGAVEIVNHDAEYHNLRARGGAFFSMPLIDANQVHERVLAKAGVVDLTCAAGYYWLNAHLFVAEHPYYALTDAGGRFMLKRVPAGTYEIVCWLPSWRVLRSECDPETGTIARLAWDAPKEQTQKVRVQAGGVGEITYRWERALFDDDRR